MNSVHTEITDQNGEWQRLSSRQAPAAARLSAVVFFLGSAALLVGPHVPPWLFMWLLAVTIFFFCKWLMWRRVALGRHVALRTRLIFFLGWVGMDPHPFLGAVDRRSNRSSFTGIANEVTGAFLRIGLGLILFAAALRGFAPPPIVRGWAAMTGLVLILHFGLFDLLAWFWHSRGFPVEPLMQRPLRSGSVSEFWSRRWNTAFNHITFTLAFRPLSRRFGPSGGIMVVFFLSGLIHELVISLPANGGYGLPTAYFVLQGLGVLLERRLFRGARRFSSVDERAGDRVFRYDGAKKVPLARPAALLNRLFTICVVAGPAFVLFHSPFLHNVILPMLRAFGGK